MNKLAKTILQFGTKLSKKFCGYLPLIFTSFLFFGEPDFSELSNLCNKS